MELLTIGAFARVSRLSPKALRLYDELALLRPARVDPETGYRYYAAGQLGRARLVAWLRRLGMPLAEIRAVCALRPGEAAREIGAYWARVEAQTAMRRDLAAFLVDQLTGTADTSEREPMTTLELRHSAHTDRGLVRPANQDTLYAGRRLLAVADGFGPAGLAASGAAVDALRYLDEAESLPVDGELGELGVLGALEDAVRAAGTAVADLAGGTGEDGSTLTALLWTGSRLALAHIGDSRAYLLRGGELYRITQDHRVSPQDLLLYKALTGGADPVPDLRLQEPLPGDRYLLCSDGLTEAVPDARIRDLLASAAGPEELVDAALAAGAPDNVTCVVADVTAAAG
ncbi:MerR family transcriptional regulator [Streptomyces sp. SID8366]|uniref:MerR family transcriptional regulator n=1 Tax=unclassified Streptomyces TaxID=2593676 RepID=UPI000DB9A20F|nr:MULTISPECIES: MerR family transcriptional regulator [unclassified Streptomyces]MYU08376.1 MerR family transcriptional regulator [Streptomyces sp. SID8366]MYU63562.1 MerR family transcriptional regulator [Streptomyces sp. SID69]RAJ62756.1 protein phosphatase [Streptomyces sp. PsTaAH-130]